MRLKYFFIILCTSAVTFLPQAEAFCTKEKKNCRYKNSCREECNAEDRQEAIELCKEKRSARRLKRGGVLFREYVDALHAPRYRREFTKAQWKTILLQKRIRIPLTAEEHRSLTKLFIDEE